jgi:hypothetical protein
MGGLLGMQPPERTGFFVVGNIDPFELGVNPVLPSQRLFPGFGKKAALVLERLQFHNVSATQFGFPKNHVISP